jgi:hypothetical protein
LITLLPLHGWHRSQLIVAFCRTFPLRRTRQAELPRPARARLHDRGAADTEGVVAGFIERQRGDLASELADHAGCPVAAGIEVASDREQRPDDGLLARRHQIAPQE